MTEPNILDKVQKLLAQAEGTDNPAEAEVFNQKASELAVKYALDLAQIQALEVKTGLLKPTTKVIRIDAPYQISKGDLVASIAAAYDCVTLRTRGRNVMLIGFESDLELVEVLYASLITQALAAVAGKRPEKTRVWERAFDGKNPAPGETKAYRKAFLTGFASEVHTRLDNVRKARGSASTDLVLRDRKAAVDADVAERFKKKPKDEKRQGQANTFGGYGHGVKAGREADLGTPALSR